MMLPFIVKALPLIVHPPVPKSIEAQVAPTMSLVLVCWVRLPKTSWSVGAPVGATPPSQFAGFDQRSLSPPPLQLKKAFFGAGAGPAAAREAAARRMSSGMRTFIGA